MHMHTMKSISSNARCHAQETTGLRGQIEQLGAQGLGAAAAELAFEFVLRGAPRDGGLLERFLARFRQAELISAAVMLGRLAEHKTIALQRLQRAHERGAFHHHRVGQLHHGQARLAGELRDDRELRRRQANLAEMAFVDLRDETRRLPQRETVAIVVRNRLAHGKEVYMCVCTLSNRDAVRWLKFIVAHNASTLTATSTRCAPPPRIMPRSSDTSL
ncbi:hypothetical protein PCAR4_440100 [Paraburkholderia caribensis]|nr:hypothetical protein PCAR4_440100 [Paraburkholderia caribensis]